MRMEWAGRDEGCRFCLLYHSIVVADFSGVRLLVFLQFQAGPGVAGPGPIKTTLPDGTMLSFKLTSSRTQERPRQRTNDAVDVDY